MIVNPEQLHAAASHIERNYGHYGYAVEIIESPTAMVSLFHVVHSDGSRFIVAADRYGNTRDVEPGQGWQAVVAAMQAAATGL